MGSVPRTQRCVCSRLQEKEFAQGAGPGVQVSVPGRSGRARALPSLLDFMPPSEKSLLELGMDVVSKSLFCQSQISTIACYHFIQEKEFHIFFQKE